MQCLDAAVRKNSRWIGAGRDPLPICLLGVKVRSLRLLVSILAALVILLPLSPVARTTASSLPARQLNSTRDAAPYPHYNEVYGIATHDSWFINRSDQVDYASSGTQETIEDQLLHDHVAALELDIHSEGASAGEWKIYGTSDSEDFSCATLSDCLQQLRNFQYADPQHDVVTVVVELKNTVPWTGSYAGYKINHVHLSFDGEGDAASHDHTIQQFDDLLRRNLGPYLYTPADFMSGCTHVATLMQCAKQRAGCPNPTSISTVSCGQYLEDQYQTQCPSPPPYRIAGDVYLSSTSILNGCAHLSVWPTIDRLRGKFIVTLLGNWSSNAYDWMQYATRGDITRHPAFPMWSLFGARGCIYPDTGNYFPNPYGLAYTPSFVGGWKCPTSDERPTLIFGGQLSVPKGEALSGLKYVKGSPLIPFTVLEASSGESIDQSLFPEQLPLPFDQWKRAIDNSLFWQFENPGGLVGTNGAAPSSCRVGSESSDQQPCSTLVTLIRTFLDMGGIIRGKDAFNWQPDSRCTAPNKTLCQNIAPSDSKSAALPPNGNCGGMKRPQAVVDACWNCGVEGCQDQRIASGFQYIQGDYPWHFINNGSSLGIPTDPSQRLRDPSWVTNKVPQPGSPFHEPGARIYFHVPWTNPYPNANSKAPKPAAFAYMNAPVVGQTWWETTVSTTRDGATWGLVETELKGGAPTLDDVPPNWGHNDKCPTTTGHDLHLSSDCHPFNYPPAAQANGQGCIQVSSASGKNFIAVCRRKDSGGGVFGAAARDGGGASYFQEAVRVLVAETKNGRPMNLRQWSASRYSTCPLSSRDVLALHLFNGSTGGMPNSNDTYAHPQCVGSMIAMKVQNLGTSSVVSVYSAGQLWPASLTPEWNLLWTERFNEPMTSQGLSAFQDVLFASPRTTTSFDARGNPTCLQYVRLADLPQRAVGPADGLQPQLVDLSFASAPSSCAAPVRVVPSTPTPTPTKIVAATSTSTATPARLNTATSTFTATPTPSRTATSTPTAINTATSTPTAMNTATSTPTPTFTTIPSPTSTATPTATLPPAQLQLSPTTVNPGDSVSFTGSGFQPTEVVNMSIGGQPVGTITAAPDGRFTGNISISSDIVPGTYTLTATGATSGQSASASFTVAAPPPTPTPTPGDFAPVITLNPQNQTVNYQGDSATFTAAADGQPAPTVQWQASDDGGQTWYNEPGATSTSYTYTTEGCGGNGIQFRAVFTNYQGTATTSAATLIINNPSPCIL